MRSAERGMVVLSEGASGLGGGRIEQLLDDQRIQPVAEVVRMVDVVAAQIRVRLPLEQLDPGRGDIGHSHVFRFKPPQGVAIAREA